MLAATSSSNSGSGVGFLVVAIIAIVFIVLIRRTNQRRVGAARVTQQQTVIGSEVMTGSGLYGTVVGQDDEQVLLEIAPGVQVRFAKAAIARVVSSDEHVLDPPDDDPPDDGPPGPDESPGDTAS